MVAGGCFPWLIYQGAMTLVRFIWQLAHIRRDSAGAAEVEGQNDVARSIPPHKPRLSSRRGPGWCNHGVCFCCSFTAHWWLAQVRLGRPLSQCTQHLSAASRDRICRATSPLRTGSPPHLPRAPRLCVLSRRTRDATTRAGFLFPIPVVLALL